MASQAIAAKDSYINILGTQTTGIFEVVGYQRQTKSAETINATSLVQVFYDQNSFQKSSSAITSPKIGDVTLKIEITVSGDAPVDIATLNNPASTPAQRQTALANAKEAAQQASELLESVWSEVWQITNDARNADLGLVSGTVAETWLDQFQRDEPVEQGGFVVVTASAQLSFRIEEPILGLTGNQPLTAIYDNTLKPTADTDDGTEDPVQQSAVEVSN